MNRDCAIGPVIGACLTLGLAACTAEQAQPLTQSLESVVGTKKEPKVLRLNGFEQHTVPQVGPTACWAAAAEMVARFNNRPESQHAIADRIRKTAGAKGGGENAIAAAGKYEIMRALVPDAPDLTADHYMGKIFSSGQTTLSPGTPLGALLADALKDNDRFIVDELAQNRPVVLGLKNKPGAAVSGHAVVIYAAAYDEWSPNLAEKAGAMFTPADQRRETMVEVRSITVADPEVAQPVEMTREEFKNRLEFVLTDDLARRTLQAFDDTVRK